MCEPVFSDDNLKLNVAKTQYFTVTKENDSWKSVKLLGSMLGTAEDIAARVSAANRAFASIPWKRHNLNLLLIELGGSKLSTDVFTSCNE